MRVGRHTVLFELARGGMAEVFVALADGAHTPCVLKRPLGGPAASETLGQRFRREGAIVSRLDHPNIARVLEVGTGDPPFIAFEYVAGQTVEHLLETLHERGERMPVELALAIVLPVLDALEHAHGLCDAEGAPLGLVHRDLTPRNLMVGYDGVVKLIDFGVARAAVDDFRTQPGVLIGTLQYFSPEQSAGEVVDAQSDLYSLSAVAFELVTGRPLVAGASPLEMLSAIYAGVVPNLSDLAPDAPRWLDAVLRRGLARERRRRWASAAELRAELLTRSAVRPDDAEHALARLMARLYPEEERAAAKLVARALAERGLDPGVPDDATVVRTPGGEGNEATLITPSRALANLGPSRAPGGLTQSAAHGGLTASLEHDVTPPARGAPSDVSLAEPRLLTPGLVAALVAIVTGVGGATAWLVARSSETVVVETRTSTLDPTVVDAPAVTARPAPRAAQSTEGAAVPHAIASGATADRSRDGGLRDASASVRDPAREARTIERPKTAAALGADDTNAERRRRITRLDAKLATLRESPDDVDQLQDLARGMREAALELAPDEKKKLDAAIDAAVRSGDIEALARGLTRLTRALAKHTE